MKKQLLIATALLAAGAGVVNALPVNRAVSFTPDGTVTCGAMPELNGLKDYSLQFWMMPNTWTEGAVLFHRGDNFSVNLGANNTVVFKNGANTVTASGFVPGEWNQVTLISSNGEATVLVNSQEGGKGTLGSLDETKRAFIMGGGYEGLLDEVRIWDDALTNNEWMARFDYFTNNTLNKWNPMWENLVAYYKMDQENCPALVEYKVLESEDGETNRHGEFSATGVNRVVVENPKMPYLVSAAYTENARFYDRLIPQDAYLLSNEIIILGADCVAEDGSVKLKTPNNHATLHGGVTYVDKKGVREGVVYLDGKAGSYIEAPGECLHKYKVDNLAATQYTNSDLSEFTFMTRVFINEWQPGAYIFCKENADHTKGFALYMGEDEKTLVARINGKENTSVVLDDFNIGSWAHIAVQPNPSGATTAYKVKFIVKGNTKYGQSGKCNLTTNDNYSMLDVADQPIKIGEGLDGWLDDTYLSNYKFQDGMIQTYINKGVPVPSVEQGQAVERMNAVGALYTYDDSEDLGYSSISQDNILKQMLKQYEGYVKPRFILSVRGHSDNNTEDAFRVIMNDPVKADKFGKDLVALGENYDGIEFDLEWMENSNTAGTTNFQSLPTAVKKYLPEGKIFRVSIHNSYYKFAEPLINDDKVTGFTVQQYGPNPDPYPYSAFTSALNTLKNEGYPANKLMTSFSTTMTSGGVKDGALKDWTWSTANTGTFNGATFMTPYQVYQRAKYTRNNGYMGIFYWDMGNDYWLGEHQNDGTNKYDGMPDYNQTKFANFAISANVDRVVNEVTLNHAETEAEPTLDVENPDTSSITSIMNQLPEYVNVYSVNGSLVKKNVKKEEMLNSLSKGIYIVNGIKVLVK